MAGPLQHPPDAFAVQWDGLGDDRGPNASAWQQIVAYASQKNNQHSVDHTFNRTMIKQLSH